MRQVFTLAFKDLRIMSRARTALFFAIGWPVLMAVLFGLMFGGGAGAPRKLRIAAVDEDRSAASEAFLGQLAARGTLEIDRTDRAAAADLVRRGTRTAAIVLPRGFAEARAHMFDGPPPAIELIADPSRRAETAMLEGTLYGLAAEAIPDALRAHGLLAAAPTRPAPTSGLATASASANADDGAQRPPRPTVAAVSNVSPASGLSSASPANAGAGGAAAPAMRQTTSVWRPIEIVQAEVTGDRRGPRSGFDVSFVQGLVWGLIGCAMTFAISLVTERTHGTLVRLRMAPLSAAQVLGGKAMACFLALLVMQATLIGIAVLGFGVQVSAPLPLIVTMMAAATAFVGLMMFIASIGRNEQATSGAGWAMLMPMSLFGGGMVPLFVMPAWMTPFSHFSLIAWAVRGFEGAIWRGFALQEFLLPWAILFTAGAIGFLLGTRNLRRAALQA